MNLHTPTDTLLPQNPDSQVGLVFRRLSGVLETYGEPALERAVRATLVTLGRATHEEAEAKARHLAERIAPPRLGYASRPRRAATMPTRSKPARSADMSTAMTRQPKPISAAASRSNTILS